MIEGEYTERMGVRIDKGMPQMPVLPGGEPKNPRNDEVRGFVSREALRVTMSMTRDVENERVDATVERNLVRDDALGRLFDRYRYPAPPMGEPWD